MQFFSLTARKELCVAFLLPKKAPKNDYSASFCQPHLIQKFRTHYEGSTSWFRELATILTSYKVGFT